MGTSYQGRDTEKQSEVGLRLEDLVSYDYSAYDSGSGEGAVEVVERWLVADDLQYSSSIEFDKESFETYSASYFLPTVINISGAFYGLFSGSGASISGSLAVVGTSSFYGPVNVSGAIRLDPTEDPGNIEPSSSFLFQSASNTDLGTDLYFRQNGQLIKFNWLVDTLFTSLLYGGVVTYSGNTVYISSGSGIIVDHNANNINESTPSVQYITWPNLSFVPTYINVRQVTYLAIDSGSNVYQNYDPFNTDDYRSKIVLGAVGHFDLANVTAFQGATLTAYDQQNQTNTFIDAFGPLKLTGYELTAQPSSFKLSVAAGTTFIHGGFYDVSPVEPSNIATVAQATASLAYVYRNGAGGVFFDTNGGAFYTNVTCSLYDDGTGSPASVSNNNWTIQRVTIDPRTGKLYIYYGQNIYATLEDALTNLSTDSFTEGDTKYFTTFLGHLVVKSNTSDLSSTADNTILNSGLFRGIGGGGGGTGGGGAGTPGGSNTQIQYNNGGTFDGNANFTFVSSSNTVFVTGSLIVSGSSTFRNIGPAQFTGSTYISSSDATQLQVGSNLLFVSSSGQVGIRNTAPNSDLEIYGVGSNNGTLRLTRGNNNANYVALSGGTSGAIYNINTSGVQDHIFQTGGTERMRISGSGNVGIGISAPIAKLQISGSTSEALLVVSSSSGPTLYVSGSGNVGIGTATPDSYYAKKLVVSAVDESGITIAGTTTSATNYLAFADGTTGNQAYRGYIVYRHLTDQLAFGTGGTLRTTIDNAGNFGIGTSTSTILARLHARGSGTTNATTALRVENTNASASLVVLDNGFVGIGTSSPAYLFDITGSDNLINISPQNSGNAIVINNNGYIKWENASLDTYMRCSNGFGLSDNGFNSKFSISFGGLSSINTGQNFSFQTGNVLVGTTTDSGFKLDISGSGRFTNGLTVTGSLIAPTITGSLQGTASWANNAISASWAPGGAAFPYIGTAIITGSLIVSGTYGGINTFINKPALYDSNNVARVVWGQGALVDASNAVSVDWQTRYLQDSAETTKVDWENSTLSDTSGVGRVFWNDGALYDGVGTVSLDWESRRLIDAAGIRSADYDARALIYPNGTSVALNYGTQDQVTINGGTIITSSLTVGSASLGPNENTITLGARDAVNEGGQIGFNAPGGTYTSASMIDLYQNRLRVLRGTNAGSDAEVAWWSMHNKQMALPAYNSATAFTGTAVASLFVDSNGQIITKATDAASTTIYVAHGNGTSAANSLSYTCYLGGTPVNITTATNAFGSAANQFMPGYPMSAPGTASGLIINLRTTGSALSAYRFYISNNDTSTTGSVITMAAGHAAGVYSGSVGQVAFNEGNRLFLMISSTFVAGAGPSGQLTTATFKYTTS